MEYKENNNADSHKTTSKSNNIFTVFSKLSLVIGIINIIIIFLYNFLEIFPISYPTIVYSLILIFLIICIICGITFGILGMVKLVSRKRGLIGLILNSSAIVLYFLLNTLLYYLP